MYWVDLGWILIKTKYKRHFWDSWGNFDYMLAITELMLVFLGVIMQLCLCRRIFLGDVC